MNHIASLINNLINGRSEEAALDIHNHIRVAMQAKLVPVKEEKEFVPILMHWAKKDFFASEIAGLIINEMSYSNDIRPRDPEKARKALNPNDPTPSNIIIDGLYGQSDADEWLSIALRRLHERDEDIDPEYSGVKMTADFDKSYLD